MDAQECVNTCPCCGAAISFIRQAIYLNSAFELRCGNCKVKLSRNRKKYETALEIISSVGLFFAFIGMLYHKQPWQALVIMVLVPAQIASIYISIKGGNKFHEVRT